MSKEFLFDDEMFEEEFDDEEEQEEQKQDSCLSDIVFCLTEIDFYPPFDDRVWTSNVEDIEDGDNFVDYCIDLFEMLEEEEYYDN